MGLSSSGSYTGRMHPPGSPKMVSTPSISRALISACDPVSCIVPQCPSSAKRERPPGWEVEERTRGVVRVRYVITRMIGVATAAVFHASPVWSNPEHP